MKDNYGHRHGDKGCVLTVDSEGTNLNMSLYSKRTHKPITSSNVWFIQKTFSRRSVRSEIIYRF